MARALGMLLSVAVALWLVLAAVGGIAAMAVFPAARELPLSMEGYTAFTAVEPAVGRQLIAGHLVERVFILSETPRLAFAGVAIVAFALQRRLRPTPPPRRLRAAAVALLASVFYARPAFTAVDREYRAAAQEAEMDPASVARALTFKAEAVDPAHSFASRVATAELLALLAFIALSAGSAQGAPRRG
ncbi:MAG: hypothetical protein LW636_07975 [Planctomycetaceae bacterium]|nr:hypothetical protein [Planctomycetaceae bacterium]